MLLQYKGSFCHHKQPFCYQKVSLGRLCLAESLHSDSRSLKLSQALWSPKTNTKYTHALHSIDIKASDKYPKTKITINRKPLVLKRETNLHLWTHFYIHTHASTSHTLLKKFENRKVKEHKIWKIFFFFFW